jgi:hypothetical protein
MWQRAGYNRLNVTLCRFLPPLHWYPCACWGWSERGKPRERATQPANLTDHQFGRHGTCLTASVVTEHA